MAANNQQFVTERDMNRIQGLLHYLNESFDLPQPAGMAVDIKLSDSNGDPLGSIEFEGESAERYVFFYGA